jgi:hypothetical protein
MGRKPIDKIVDMAVMVTESARSALKILHRIALDRETVK